MKFTLNENVLRVALLIFSVIFGLLSLSLMALGAVYIDDLWWPRRYVGLDFMELPTLLIVLGVASFIMAIIGCICAKSVFSMRLFRIFIVCLVVIICLELTLAVISFENIEGLSLKKKRMMMDDFAADDTIKETNGVEVLTHHYDCCGFTGDEDYCDTNSAILKMASELKGCFSVINDLIAMTSYRIGIFSIILLILQVNQIGIAFAIRILAKPE